jgi:ATP-dependent 26S proteasome regulatory subunit
MKKKPTKTKTKTKRRSKVIEITREHEGCLATDANGEECLVYNGNLVSADKGTAIQAGGQMASVLSKEQTKAKYAWIKVRAIVKCLVTGSAGSGSKKGKYYTVTGISWPCVNLQEVNTNVAIGWVFPHHIEAREMKVGDKAVVSTKKFEDGEVPNGLSEGDFVEITKIGASGLIEVKCLVSGKEASILRNNLRFFDEKDQVTLNDTLVAHRRVLESSRIRLLEQDSLIRELLRKPTHTTQVLKIHRDGTKEDEDSWVLTANGGLHKFPRQFEVENGTPLAEGMIVALAQTGEIDCPAPLWDERGLMGYVAVDQVEGEAVVWCRPNLPETADEKEGYAGMVPTYPGSLKNLKAGDQVTISREGVIQKKVADAKPKKVSVPKSMPRVLWSEVGGVDKAKRELIEAIETPKRFPDLFRGYGSNMPKGVELFGPPGCGKTLIAKACVTMMADLRGSEVVHESAFIYVKGPEILDKYVGEAESKIRKMCEAARQHFKEHGYNAILFIDEADAVLMRRGSNRSSDVDKTIVPMFLAEMDGMDTGGPFLLLATNMPNNLDEAVVRPGRIDRSIEVPRPNLDSSFDIFKIHLSKVPLHPELAMDLAALQATKHLFQHTDHCHKNVSGALIANVVQRAAMSALAQDVAKGRSSPSGITLDDLTSAMAEIDMAGAARAAGGRTADARA